MISKKPLIGFIGQGWIGKNYATDFECRGFKTIRYSLEDPYIKNKEEIKKCDLVFIALPTPTTPRGFDASLVGAVLKLIGKGKTAIIKSTILPGTTEALQAKNKNIFVMHSPEFLAEATAAYDAAHPTRNIIGIPKNSAAFRGRAQQVLDVLPVSKVNQICSAKEAELIKYGSNCFLYLKVVYANLLYDLSKSLGNDYNVVKNLIGADPRIGLSHLNPVDKTGRGAGGHCFVKDFEAFISLYQKKAKDELGLDVLRAVRNKNVSLLKKSKKSLDLIKEVYGI
jgi:UDPglucose 6-dehydrogenase